MVMYVGQLRRVRSKSSSPPFSKVFIEGGPFVKALDKALATFHVQRQAYYSGIFIGNHVHRTLKVT